MRIVFAGSSEFALPSLRALAEAGHEVTLVLTAADRPGDRGRLAARPVSDLARKMGLAVAQPLRLTAATPEVEAARADLLVVCAYGQLLPEAVLAAFPLRAWGVHPSLLPRHRGASPIAAAILAGDDTTGVTIYAMDERMDAGPILAQATIAVEPRATTPSLTRELAQVASVLLVKALEQQRSGELTATPQDELLATYSHKLSRRDGVISWTMAAVEIDRLVRALQPWPGTSCELQGGPVKLLAGEPQPGDNAGHAPGALLGWEGDSARVATGAGAYLIHSVQPPSGKPMTPAAYVRGRRPGVR